MRIGVMLRHYDQHGGGVKVYTQRLLRALFDLGSDHEFVLLYRNPSLVGTYRDERGTEKDWTFQAKVCRAWRDEQVGKLVVKSDDFAEAKANVKAIKTNPSIQQILDCSDCQVHVAAEYRDKTTGIVVAVKCLLDLVPKATDPIWGKCLGDLKLTTNASQGAWTKKVWEEGYAVQAATYQDIYRAAC